MKLTVIVCIYNTAHAYVDECLASIRREKLEDYEILIVDDGSSLDYSELVEKYGVEYTKTENRGLLAARLHGLNLARGEYIAFVDSDDTVSLNYHQPMLDAAQKYDADIVINGWAFHTEKTKKCCLRDITLSREIDVSSPDTLLFYTELQGKDHSVFVQWNKVFRKALLLRAAEEIAKTDIAERGITYGEDALLNFYNYKHASRIVGINSGFYFYRMHSEQSVVASSVDKLKRQIDCMSYAFDMMIASSEGVNNKERIVENIIEWREMMSRTHYSYAKADGHTNLYDYIKTAYHVDVLKLPPISDSLAYIKYELIGYNFDEIDQVLTSIYFNGENTNASYDKSSKYLLRILQSMKTIKGIEVTYSRKSSIVIPKKKVRLIDKITHAEFVYRVGMILFKKGSKLRNLLKRYL